MGKRYQEGYSQVMERKDQGQKQISGYLDSVLNFVSGVFISSKERTVSTAETVWERAKDNKYVSEAFTRAEPTVNWVQGKYMSAHDAVVANKYYQQLWDTGCGITTKVTKQPVYQATAGRVLNFFGPYIDPLLHASIVQRAYEHVKPAKEAEKASKEE